MARSSLMEAFRQEWARRKQAKLVELLPVTIEFLQAFIRQDEPIEHLQERATFLLKGYLEAQGYHERELRS